MKTFLITIILICILRVGIPMIYWDGPIKQLFWMTTDSDKEILKMLCVAVTFIINCLPLYLFGVLLEKVMKEKF